MERRRKHNRFDFLQQISYVMHPSASGGVRTGTIVNLSRSGLCLWVRNPIVAGQEITIRTTIDIHGVVVWCRERIENPDAYELGLKFLPEVN